MQGTGAPSLLNLKCWIPVLISHISPFYTLWILWSEGIWRTLFTYSLTIRGLSFSKSSLDSWVYDRLFCSCTYPHMDTMKQHKETCIFLTLKASVQKLFTVLQIFLTTPFNFDWFSSSLFYRSWAWMSNWETWQGMYGRRDKSPWTRRRRVLKLYWKPPRVLSRESWLNLTHKTWDLKFTWMVKDQPSHKEGSDVCADKLCVNKTQGDHRL